MIDGYSVEKMQAMLHKYMAKYDEYSQMIDMIQKVERNKSVVYIEADYLQIPLEDTVLAVDILKREVEQKRLTLQEQEHEIRRYMLAMLDIVTGCDVARDEERSEKNKEE